MYAPGFSKYLFRYLTRSIGLIFQVCFKNVLIQRVQILSFTSLTTIRYKDDINSKSDGISFAH